MSEEIKINKKKMYKYFGILIISLFIIMAFKNIVFASSSDNSGNQKIFNKVTNENGVQIVNLGVANYNYDPNTIYLKAGVRARIVGDINQLAGCLRTIIIPGLGLSKSFSQGDNILEFTPTSKGTFGFSCPMRMGTGTIIVQ